MKSSCKLKQHTSLNTSHKNIFSRKKIEVIICISIDYKHLILLFLLIEYERKKQQLNKITGECRYSNVQFQLSRSCVSL